MPPVVVDPEKVHEFADAEAFYAGSRQHHDREPEVWIKIHKLGSGLQSITPKEAIDVALCWGWIDAVRKGLDEQELPAALHAARPQEHLEPDQRRQRRPPDRRGPDDRARPARRSRPRRPTAAGTAPTRAASDMAIPDDLQAAIDAEPAARAMLARLSAQNRFALAFRTHNMKTEAGRAKKIAAFVEMLERGETIYPGNRRSRTGPPLTI